MEKMNKKREELKQSLRDLNDLYFGVDNVKTKKKQKKDCKSSLFLIKIKNPQVCGFFLHFNKWFLWLFVKFF